MIHGVKIKDLKLFHDDRGFLTEVFKEDDPFYVEIKQTTYTETHPGVIKAFHYHKKQTDFWFVCRGTAQVVLHDLREDSPTRGRTCAIYLGEKNPKLLVIPPGVAHGYRVLGNKSVALLYHTDQKYDPNDEHRIPFNDASIGFNWETENR